MAFNFILQCIEHDQLIAAFKVLMKPFNWNIRDQVMPKNPFTKSSAVSQRLYHREIGIYRHFHTLLRKLRAEKSLRDCQVPLNVPHIYYTNLSANEAEDAPSVLVMEDLKIQGFYMVDKMVSYSR